MQRIFEDVGGWHTSDDSLDYLDTRGPAFESLADAQRYLASIGESHYVRGGRRIRIRQEYR